MFPNKGYVREPSTRGHTSMYVSVRYVRGGSLRMVRGRGGQTPEQNVCLNLFSSYPFKNTYGPPGKKKKKKGKVWRTEEFDGCE